MKKHIATWVIVCIVCILCAIGAAAVVLVVDRLVHRLASAWP